MAKARIQDYTANLSAQLKEAGEQMRRMRTPPKHDVPESSALDEPAVTETHSEPFDLSALRSAAEAFKSIVAERKEPSILAETSDAQIESVSDPIRHQTPSLECAQVSSSVIKCHRSSTDTADSLSNSSPAPVTLPGKHVSGGGARKLLLGRLAEISPDSGQVIVNMKQLAPALGLSYGTVRNTMSRLVREGVLRTTQVRIGDMYGVCVELVDGSQVGLMKPVMPHQEVLSQAPSGLTTRHPDPSESAIWNTDAETIALLWPHAYTAGFAPSHLAQLRSACRFQGWNAENVPRCLRYLDWELSTLTTSETANVDPVLRWLRLMQRQGFYPKPDGYFEKD